MRAFSQDSRTEKRKDGLFFYEQDALYSPYLLSGNVVVDLIAKFEAPGIGFILAEDNELGFRESVHRYLFDLGSYEFNVYEKHDLVQTKPVTNSCTVAPATGSTVHLRLKIRNRKVEVRHVFSDEAGKEKEELIGSFKFSRKFDTYRIGIYANAGNTVSDVSFLQDAPDNWQVSTKNIRGGLVTFFQDGFRLEKCMQDAEIEQDGIELKKGTYWFRFNRDKVDDACDIQAYLFPSNPKRAKDGRVADSSMEDPKKNLLDKQGKFTVTEDGLFDLKFKGTTGKASKIAIMDTPKSDYVETHEKAVTTKGSEIVISLAGLAKVEWDGVITDVPEYLDLRKPCPYSILLTDDMNVNLNNFLVKKDTLYHYVYDCEVCTLRAYDKNGAEQDAIFVIFDPDGTKDKITLFQNISGVAYNLTLTYKKGGSAVNVNLQKTYRSYVPATISGPILVTDAADTPYDLSASYRDCVLPNWQIDFFNKNQTEMRLTHNTSTIMAKPEFYGIPKGAKIQKDATDIQTFCKDAIPIGSVNADLIGNRISMLDNIRNRFERIAVRYQSSEDFYHIFTNYEREIFEDSSYVVLEHYPAIADESMFVYGIPEDGEVYSDYFYRIPQASMMNSIDLFASKYDVIPSSLYTVIPTTGEVLFDKTLHGKYQGYVIDYLKRDSYAINYEEESGQYALDISSEEPSVLLHYDMDEDSESNMQIRTKIKPDKNKFVVLRRKQGEVFDD